MGVWRGMLPFGGGKHFSSARRLAFVEIVSFVSLVVCMDLRFRRGVEGC